jgi:hypothetical protein
MTDPPRRRKKRRARPPAAATAPRLSRPSRQPRQLVAVAAAGMLLGIALTATSGPGDGPGAFFSLLGPWVSVLSMALAIGAAHTLGRTGPDPGIFASAPTTDPPASDESPDPDPGGHAS